MQLPRGLFLPLIAGIGFIVGIRGVILGASTPPPAPPVSAPATSPFPATVAGSGIIEASSENIAIAAPAGGVITNVFVKAGEVVTAGTPLFTLDDRELRAELLVNESELAVAEAELTDARSRLKRVQTGDGRAVSIDERQNRENAVAIAAAKVERASSAVAATKLLIERLTVRAPLDGTVLQMRARPGEFAPAAVLSSPLLVLGSISPLHVRVDIDENDAWRLVPAAPATASIRGNSQLTMKLSFVRKEPLVIPKRSLTGESTERVDTRVLQLIYRVDTPYPESLLVGQLVDVFIEAQ